MILGKFKRDFQQVTKQHLDALIAEIHETKELLQLLTQAVYQGLTDQEKEKVREQILDIIKALPALIIRVVPQ